MNLNSTIAAIATAMGPSGVGVIRISGKETLSVVQTLFHASRPKFDVMTAQSHYLHHGWIKDGDQAIDEVLVAIMRAPQSYTTEDVAEIQCHGSVVVLQTILELILDQGVRLAEPGEFTQRAFFYGRLDLTQVEAVSDLIHARSRLGVHAAVDQLKGKLHDAIFSVKEKVAYVAALIEASIDFSDEDEEFAEHEACVERLTAARSDLERLLASAEQGKLMRSGLGVALIGRPNVGKSSLLNALLREQRAIVTDIAGTTRDIIEESIQVRGLAIRLIDTAGIRETEDVVEVEGVKRSQEAKAAADVLLLILDVSGPLSADERQLLQNADPQKTVVVLNKTDLLQGSSPLWAQEFSRFTQVWISATHSEGIAELEQAIYEKGTHGMLDRGEQTFITNMRQQQAAKEALEILNQAIGDLLNGIGEECIAVDLSSCLRALGTIVGETTADDLLNRIFAEFCIGK